MTETYRCPKCLAPFSSEEARAARYQCPACSQHNGQPPAYLVAWQGATGQISILPQIPKLNVNQPDVEEDPESPQPTNDGEGESAVAEKSETVATSSGLTAQAKGETELHAETTKGFEGAAEVSDQREQPVPPSTTDTPPSHDAPLEPTQVSDASVALVLPPPRNEIDAAAMEQLAGTLAQLSSPIALEISGEYRQRQLRLRGKSDVVARIEAQLYAIYEQVDVQPLPADMDMASGMEAPGKVIASAQLCLAGPEFLSLKTWREFEGKDPLRPLLGAFDAVQLEERLLSQLIIHGSAPEGWASGHLRQLAALKRRGYGADAPMPAKNILGWTVGVGLILVAGVLMLSALVMPDWRAWLAIPLSLGLVALAIACLRLSDNPWAETLDDEAALKLRDKAFQCELRLFACASTRARAEQLLNQLMAAYQAFDTTSGNRLQAIRLEGSLHPSDLKPTPKVPRMVLNVKELAGLWHMPVGQSLELIQRQTYERLLPLPGEVTYPNGAPIGASHKGKRTVSVSLSSEALLGNMFFIGKTQHGKSTLMAHIALRWMADRERSVVILDPHGDLARQLLGLIPPERLADVIYFDLSDETRSMGLNLIDVSDGTQPHEVAEMFMDVGKALWKDYWGPRMAIPLQFGLRALACANQRRPPERQYTILSLVSLLTADPEVREAFLRREVPLEDQPGLHQYFLGQYNLESQIQREQVISPVLSKAHAFERTPAIRRLVGQSRSTLQLFEAIRARKILIVNTNSGVLGDDLAGFAGSLILNIMRRVITQQTTLPRAERVRVSVIADEFQIMTGTDFGALLGELQKNGGNFVLGTQSLDSLLNIDPSGALAGKLFAGVTTKAVFQVNGSDAHYLVKHELDCERLQPESLMNLPKYCAYLKTVNGSGRPIPVCTVDVAALPELDPRKPAAIRAHQATYTVPAAEADRLADASLLRFSDEYSILTAQGEPAAHGTSTPAEPDTSLAEQLTTRPIGERDGPVRPKPQQESAPNSEAQRTERARPKAQPPNVKASNPASEQAAFEAALGQVVGAKARH